MHKINIYTAATFGIALFFLLAIILVLNLKNQNNVAQERLSNIHTTSSPNKKNLINGFPYETRNSPHVRTYSIGQFPPPLKNNGNYNSIPNTVENSFKQKTHYGPQPFGN